MSVVVVGLAAAFAAGLAPGQLSGPVSLEEIERDADAVELDLAELAGERAATVTMTLSVGGRELCTTDEEAVVVGVVGTVTFDISDCGLAELPESVKTVDVTISSSASAGTLHYAGVELSPPASEAAWDRGLREPLRWGLAAGIAAFVGSSILSLVGSQLSGRPAFRPAPVTALKKVRPGGMTRRRRMPWNLPAKPLSGIDFGTAGTAGRLLFVGTAVSTVLALGDVLDPVFDERQQLVLATASVISVLIAGLGPVILGALQATYTPTITKQGSGPAALADVQLVASVPGVVLGSSVTAMALAVQIAALAWAGHVAGVDLWTWRPPGFDRELLMLPAFLGLGTTAYCVMFAGSTVLSGRQPPLVDDPEAPATPPSAQPPGTIVIVTPASVPTGRRLLP